MVVVVVTVVFLMLIDGVAKMQARLLSLYYYFATMLSGFFVCFAI
jgi:hypothetical protein